MLLIIPVLISSNLAVSLIQFLVRRRKNKGRGEGKKKQTGGEGGREGRKDRGGRDTDRDRDGDRENKEGINRKLLKNCQKFSNDFPLKNYRNTSEEQTKTSNNNKHLLKKNTKETIDYSELVTVVREMFIFCLFLSPVLAYENHHLLLGHQSHMLTE